MKKLNTKKETIINTHQVSMIEFIEMELNNKHLTEHNTMGYVKSVKFSSEDDSVLINKAELIYSIQVEVHNKTIGFINYHYEVIPSDDAEWLNIPSFEKGNFNLLDENEQFFSKNIKELQEELTD